MHVKGFKVTIAELIDKLTQLRQECKEDVEVRIWDYHIDNYDLPIQSVTYDKNFKKIIIE